MPFYIFKHEDEYIEEMFPMDEIPEEFEKDGKVYTYVPTFSTNFVLKGVGWATKNNATASAPKLSKEVGIRVDNDLKAEMERSGEKI